LRASVTCSLILFVLLSRHPPSTLFPTRRSSDLSRVSFVDTQIVAESAGRWWGFPPAVGRRRFRVDFATISFVLVFTSYPTWRKRYACSSCRSGLDRLVSRGQRNYAFWWRRV